jgi:phospholipid/cholesterol/gamma-HCH transport system substrate-binding protein
MSRVARLGLFVLLTLVVLATGVFIIGSKEYLFGSTYELKTKFDNVAGLAPGADVEVGGVHSGTVRSIALPHSPNDKVTVVMNLDKSTDEIVKKDSVASIETEGLLGNEYVAISFGSQGQAAVQNGDTIASTPPLQMGALLNKASGILDSSQQAVKNVTTATAHLDSVSAKVDSGKGTVGALVNDKQLYNNLEQTTGELHSTVVKAQVGITDFQEDMEALKHNFLLSGYFKKRGYEDQAQLDANKISGLPSAQPLKTFVYTAKQLFDKQDSAKLKHEKSLNDAGKFLADNEFGIAVIEVSSGKEGDAQKDLTLTEARALVVREYLVGKFGFDDTALKTLGMGKNAVEDSDAEGGSIKILIYAPGTGEPSDKSADSSSSPSKSAQTSQSSSENARP